MKTLSIVLSGLLAFASISSCKKDDAVSKGPVTVEGVWNGTYSFGSGPSDKFFGFALKPGGVIEELNSSGAKIGEGTWEIENDRVTANYTRNYAPHTEFSMIGSFKKDEGRMTGTWGYVKSAIDGGSMNMNKK